MSFIPIDLNIPHEFIKTKTIGKCSICNHDIISIIIKPPDNEYEHNQTDLNFQNLYKKEQQRINKRLENIQHLITPCPTCNDKKCIIYVNNIRTHITHLDDVPCCDKCMYFPIARFKLYQHSSLIASFNMYDCTVEHNTTQNRIHLTYNNINNENLLLIIKKCFQELTKVNYNPYDKYITVKYNNEFSELMNENNLSFTIEMQYDDYDDI